MSVLEFELNLARVLAHSMVYFTREEYSPGGIVDDAVNEDEDAPDPMESTAESMAAFLQYLPAFMNAQMTYGPQLEQSKLTTAQQTSPQWSKLQTDLFKTFGPQLAQTSQKIDASNKMAGAQADAAVLAGPGRDTFRAVQDMLKESDPEFFAIRGQAADQVSDLLSPGLTGAETEAVERKLARDRVTSGIGTPTSTNTVAEAMQFGDAARNRQLQGVAAATSFLPSSRTGFDPSQVALGRPSINTGDSKFQGITQPASAEGSTNNFFNQIAGFRNTQMGIDSQKRDWIDRVNEGASSINV